MSSTPLWFLDFRGKGGAESFAWDLENTLEGISSHPWTFSSHLFSIIGTGIYIAAVTCNVLVLQNKHFNCVEYTKTVLREHRDTFFTFSLPKLTSTKTKSRPSGGGSWFYKIHERKDLGGEWSFEIQAGRHQTLEDTYVWTSTHTKRYDTYIYTFPMAHFLCLTMKL